MKKHGTTLAIIGLGRIGFPFGLYLSKRGFRVYGIDRDKQLIDAYRQGELPFRVSWPKKTVQALLNHALLPTTDYAVVKKADYIVITVGGAGERKSDLESVQDVIQTTLPYFRKGHTLIIRSTVPPQSTMRIGRLIEKHSTLRVGKTIFLAYCPERSLEGKALDELAEIPQIIGADDPASKEKATSFFRRLTEIVLPTSTVSAELAKLFSNVYRYVDFALANEFMMIAENLGQNIYEIRRLVNEGYERGGLKRPGLTAGPCLPKSTQLIPSSTTNPGLGKIAYKINESIPEFLIRKIREHRKGDLEGAKVAILGKTFKGNIDDDRNSLVPKLVTLLTKGGSMIAIHDPYVLPDVELRDVLRGADVVIVGANHDAYKRIKISKLHMLVNQSVLVCDIWNVFGQNKILYIT